MGRKKGRRRASFSFKPKSETVMSIAGMTLITLGLLIIVSFAGQGTLLAVIYQFMKEYFGIATLIVPVLFIFAGLSFIQLKWRITKPNNFYGAAIIFFSQLVLLKAGSIGQSIFISLAGLIEPLGANIVMICIFLIGVLIMTDSSLENTLLNLSSIIKWFTGLKQRLSSSTPDPKFDSSSQFNSSRAGFTIKGGRPQPPVSSTASNPSSSASKPPLPATSMTPAPTPVTTTTNATSGMVYDPPSLDLLDDKVGGTADRGDIKANAKTIQDTLHSFNISAKVVEVNLGPAVTQYALEIKSGVKLSRITALQNDLALALAAPTGQIRIEAPIPGRALVGMEIPNRNPEVVSLKEVLDSPQMKKTKSKTAIALGLNVSGEVVVTDITKMPHALIAGATGSGKSVSINAFITQILYRASPDEVRFIMVDPKRVELTQYNGIPHLLTPVIVEPDKVVAALEWAINEMQNRYKLFVEVGVKNIESYNNMSGIQSLPYLIIIIDELADIMLLNPTKVEDAITRLAQMARATGIHLLLATQRPSVDVLTGLIKANVPCRIAFNVTTMIDSRVILDSPGAEKLLGKGDMLYVPPDQAKPTRIQGAFVSDAESRRIIEHLKNLDVPVEYLSEVTTAFSARKLKGVDGRIEDVDASFEEAVRIVTNYDRASASLLQRRLSIGYARAARILDQLQQVGIVGPQEGSKPREVLIRNADDFFAKQEGH